MSANDPLASADDLAVMLGVPATDSKLLLALRRASNRFRAATRREVTFHASDTVTLGGDGGQTLRLPDAPISNVSVTVGGASVDDYQVDGVAGVLRRPVGWPDELGSITVVYDHGWQDVPEDIADVVLEQAANVYTVMPGVAAYTTGSESRTYSAGLIVGVSAAWSACVARYRLLLVRP